MKIKVWDTKLKKYRVVRVALIIPSTGKYQNKIIYDGKSNGETALWVENNGRYKLCD